MPKIFLKAPAHDGRELHPRGPCDWPEGVKPPSSAEDLTEELEADHDAEEFAKDKAKKAQLTFDDLTPKTADEVKKAASKKKE